MAMEPRNYDVTLSPQQPINQLVAVDGIVRFLGTSELKVGPTGVVTFPKNHQKVLIEGNEGHLVLLPRNSNEVAYWQMCTFKAYNQKLENAKKNPVLTPKQKKFVVDTLTGSAIHIELDSQGRFTLAKNFIDEKLNESREIVLESADSCEGTHSHIKIWAKKDHVAELDNRRKLAEEEMKGVMAGVLDN